MSVYPSQDQTCAPHLLLEGNTAVVVSALCTHGSDSTACTQTLKENRLHDHSTTRYIQLCCRPPQATCQTGQGSAVTLTARKGECAREIEETTELCLRHLQNLRHFRFTNRQRISRDLLDLPFCHVDLERTSTESQQAIEEAPRQARGEPQGCTERRRFPLRAYK